MAQKTNRNWQEEFLPPVIWIGIFLLLLTPYIATSGTLYPFSVGKATYVRGITEIIVTLWIILAFKNHRYRIGSSWILGIFVAYLAISLISSIVGSSPTHSFWGDYRRMGGVFDLTHWIVLLAILISMARTLTDWDRLLNVNLCVSLSLALVGLDQHLNLDTVSNIFWYLESKERLDLTLGNPAYVGAYMMVNALIGTALLSRSYLTGKSHDPTHKSQSKIKSTAKKTEYYLFAKRSFWALVILTNLWVMLLSGTRGAILGLSAAIIFTGITYLLLGDRRQLRLISGIVASSLLLLIISFPLVRTTTLYEGMAKQNITLERLRNVGISEQLSIRNRTTTARIAFNAYVDKPILGWGPENFALAFQMHEKPDDFGEPFLSDQAHNRLLNELTTTGTLGFIVYLLIWGRVGQVAYRKIRANPNESLFTILLASALIAYFVQNLFLFDVHATYLQMILLMGWFGYAETSMKTEPREETKNPKTQKNYSVQNVKYKNAPVESRLSFISHGKSVQLRLAELTAQRSHLISWFAGTLLIGIATISLYFAVFLPYQSAQIFPTRITGPNAVIAWEEFWNKAIESFDTFPPLAILPRAILFETIVSNWETMNQLGVENLTANVALQAIAAIQADPNNPKLYMGLGKVYQKAAKANPKYLEQSRKYSDAALRLAPGTIETGLLVIEQEILEGNYGKALEFIDRYDHSGLTYKFRRPLLDFGETARYEQCRESIAKDNHPAKEFKNLVRQHC